MNIETLHTLDEVKAAAVRMHDAAHVLRRDWFERTLSPEERDEVFSEMMGLSLSISCATGVVPLVNSGPTPTQIKADPELRRIVRERRESRRQQMY